MTAVPAAHRHLRHVAAVALGVAIDIVVPPRCAACCAMLPARTAARQPHGLARCIGPVPGSDAATDAIVGLCPACSGEMLAAPAVLGAALVDEGPAAALVRRGKNGSLRSAGEVLAATWQARASRGLAAMPDVDLVTWVPHDPLRGARRGYHLPELFGRAVARRLGAPAHGLLERLPGRAQRGSDDAARRSNVRHAYHARPAAARLLRSPTADPGSGPLRILLVDDVRTTGSTLDAAGAALQAAAAAPVVVVPFAFAAVPRRHPSRAEAASVPTSRRREPVA